MHEVLELYKKSSWLSVLGKFICHVSGWHYSSLEGEQCWDLIAFLCVYLLYASLFRSMFGNLVAQVLCWKNSVYVPAVKTREQPGGQFQWDSTVRDSG